MSTVSAFTGDHSSSAAGGQMSFSGDERGFDMSDVMDISCDPPGPSSGRPTPSSVTFSSHQTSLSDPPEEEIQSVTTHLSQVAVTHNLECLPAVIRSKTPSLEESRGLTSSAEELSTALGPTIHHTRKTGDNVWVPIDRPYRNKSQSESPETFCVERPQPREPVRPVNANDNPWFSDSRNSRNNFTDNDNNSSICLAPNSTNRTGLAWNRIASGKSDNNRYDDSSNINNASNKETSAPLVNVNLCSDTHFSIKPSNIPSTTTSEDDMIVATENKRDKKKKKRKSNKNEIETLNEPKKLSNIGSNELRNPPTFIEDSKINKNLNLEADHFHAAKEYHKSTSSVIPELPLDNFHEPTPKEFHEAPPEEFHEPHPEEFHEPPPEEFHEPPPEEFREPPPEELHEPPLEELHEPIQDEFHEPPPDEFHEPPPDEFHDPINEPNDTLYQEPPNLEVLCQSTENLHIGSSELQEQEENFSEIESSHDSEGALLKSIHDDNDLARALEEAYSSDDNVMVSPTYTTRTTSKTRSERNSEMFPFRESSSEDDRCTLRLRTAANSGSSVSTSSITSNTTGLSTLGKFSGLEEVSSTDDRGETSGEDRTESSADDRKTTSESDVGASPNPRTSSNSKNKKKKKKKR